MAIVKTIHRGNVTITILDDAYVGCSEEEIKRRKQHTADVVAASLGIPGITATFIDVPREREERKAGVHNDVQVQDV